MQIPGMNKLMPVYIIITAALAWFALGLQFYVLLTGNLAIGISLKGTVITFFSYFTILTNLLVALCLTSILVSLASGWGQFFSSPSVKAALTVYITMVSLIYHLLLRQYWHPKGLAGVADELLHTVIPALFIIYWLAFVPRGFLKGKNLLAWMVYPLIYLLYTLVHGAWSHFYPYPFIDVNQLGYQQVLLHVALLLLAFTGISVVFIAIDRLARQSLLGHGSS